MGKRLLILFLLQHFFLMKIASGNEKELPHLTKTHVASQEIFQTCWSVSVENQLYPFLQATFDHIEFLTPTGDVISRYNYLPHSSIVCSENQEFVAFLDQDEVSAQQELFLEKKENLAYHLIAKTGEKIYSIPIELNYDDPLPAMLIADNGQSVLLDGRDGSATVFAPAGDRQDKIDIFKDDEFAFEKPINAAISSTGKILAILAQRRPMTFDENKNEYISGEPWVIFYSLENQQEAWRQPLHLAAASTISLSPSGNYIAVSAFTPSNDVAPVLRSIIYANDGDKVIEFPCSFAKVEFTKDETSAFFMNRDELIQVDLLNKKYQIKYTIDQNKGKILCALKINQANKTPFVLMAKSIFQNERFEFVEPVVVGFDEQWQPKWEINFTGEKFIAPSIVLNKNEIGIGFLSNYKLYEVSRAK